MNEKHLRPAVQPIYFVLSRAQIEAEDITEPLSVLHQLATTRDKAVVARGRISLVVDGFDHDPRELFEITAVRRYIRSLDDRWPYWLFFLSQADDSIVVLESCLCDAIEVVPGVTSIDTRQLELNLARHFSALYQYCASIGLPESLSEEITDSVLQLLQNSMLERIEGDEFG